MPLAAGTRVGHYEIVSAIGAGGMGEVYRARDTSLKRDVALKTLPESFASESERLARFQREAELLASLNHPNIAAIYGLTETDGVRALVMELVDGEDLADRIAHGPIPVDEALPIAKQIADALEAAHEHGIIHRDLKPANVKLRGDGTVKVLDFGLAKAMEPAGPMSPAMARSPTITSPAMMTGVGMLLGTAAYMSPEQARGKAVDKRADIWAFGCVLFEMLTGKRAFPGDDVTDTIVSVLSKEPDWSALPAVTPAFIRALLRRGMDKDPRRRLRDIGDARLALEGAFDAAGAESAATATAPGGRVTWMAVAVALLAATVLAIPTFLYFRAGSVDAPEMRLDIVTPGTTDQLSFALSPDGRQFVYGDGNQRLWLRPLDKTTARPLAATERASSPFWSPDGRSLGFFASGQLKRLDLVGGGAQALAAVSVTNARGGTWGPDGTILFAAASTGPLFRIPATGGKAAAVTTLDKQTGHRFPQFLPGGRQFLFYALGTPDTTGIYLGSLDGPEMTRLTAADSAGVYSPQGWLLFVRAGTLLAQRLDLEQRALVGNPVTVAEPVGRDSSPGPTMAASVSATGLVAYRAGGTGRRQLTWFDRSGKRLGVVGAPDENDLLAPRLSPDGRRVAAHRTIQGNVDIWLLDADRTTRFTFDPAADKFPVWSPDGGRIVFDSDRKGSRDLYVAPSSSAGSEKLLLESVVNAHDWSPDGRFISYVRIDSQTAGDMWMLPLDGDRKPFVILHTPFDERRGMFSPDGRWLAYHANPSGSYEVYVRPFPGPGGEQPVSTMGGVYPRWRADGNELYYLAPDGTLMAAPIAVRGATLESGRPVALFRTRIVGGGTNVNLGMNYDIARDGRFLINTILEGASASPITVLLNWRPKATP